MNLKSTLVAALSFAAFAGAASAVPIITATNVTSSWGSTAGGVAVDENVSYGRLPGSAADPFNQVRWGTPANPSFATRGKSGLGFQSLAPVPIKLGVDFAVGKLRHYNWTIAPGTNAAGSQLDIGTTLNVEGSAQGPYTFSSKFTVDETLNVAPCAYPSARPCSDKITFSNVAGGDTFTIGGIVYTLTLIGFGNTSTTLQDSFLSEEGGTTDTFLWARITAVDTPPTPTPEPAPLALLALGLSVWVG